MLWEIDIHPAEGQPDRAAERIATSARELRLAADLRVAAARGFLIQSESLQRDQVEQLASQLLADVVVERTVIGRVGEPQLNDVPASLAATRSGARPSATILFKPGVMDPVAQSALIAAEELGISAQ